MKIGSFNKILGKKLTNKGDVTKIMKKTYLL